MRKSGSYICHLAVQLVLVGLLLVVDEKSSNSIRSTADATSENEPILSSSLVDWISREAEDAINELEAIANANANTNLFNVVNYVRYVNLYENLKAVAINNIDKLKWVQRKMKALSKAHQSTIDILQGYLEGLDATLTRIELNEPKGQAVGVNQDWVKNYKIINYIATHAPAGSNLSQNAFGYLMKSPNGIPDKRRSVRYNLYSRANP